jgi:hypothetical protein
MSAVESAADTKQKNTFDITVIYNGVSKLLTVNLHQTISTVLQHAIHQFGSPPNPHTLALFTEAGVELQDSITVEKAGLTARTRLLLRPSAVKGG